MSGLVRILGLCFLLMLPIGLVQATVWQVGHDRPLKNIRDVARKAVDGDVVEIDSGDYYGDVVAWTQPCLTLRGVGGRVRLYANGTIAEGKAIWVIRGKQVTVENIEFLDAQVPDHNGAGIRLESGSLIVRNCRFINNQDGILTSNVSDISLEVYNSEFSSNFKTTDLIMHNLYAGSIARLVVSGSYFHHANTGHLLKSRAATNIITYNRLTDEVGGKASYELEFPNGGVAVVVGNIIEQSATTENPTIIAYGLEGLKYPENTLYLTFNSIFDDRSWPGRVLLVKGDGVRVAAYNNVLTRSRWDLPVQTIGGGNIEASPTDFVQVAQYDYRPTLRAQWLYRVVPIPEGALSPALREQGVSLVPQSGYNHPSGTKPLRGNPRSPGALQSVAN